MPETITTTAPAAKPATLDDVMIAMDVVDTMRHREDLVARELNEAGREKELIERLKDIYKQQGIDVPDKVLAEGVKALRESRFTYAPPPAGWKRSLLTVWVKRDRYTRIGGVALVALMGSWGLHYYNVTRPQQLADEQVRVEITETLPKSIRQAHADVLAVSTDAEARKRAADLLADGERAIRDRDKSAMDKSASALRDLRTEIVSEYTLTVVSRPGETSGVWRRPPKGSTVRNYYLIVEALAPNGTKLKLPIRNEEDGRVETVDKFGVRVPQATFDAVAADKRDDGIIQRNSYGVKRRGALMPDYLMPFEGGMITRW